MLEGSIGTWVKEGLDRRIALTAGPFYPHSSASKYSSDELSIRSDVKKVA
jgi:hypothetical protein